MRAEFDFERDEAARLEKAEETLRLVAQLPPPDGLTQRVHRRLAEASEPERGFWRLWMPAHRMQFAGAALLVVAIAASTLIVRHPKADSPAAPPQARPGSGLGTAGAERRPGTLAPIHVPAPAVKKKPSAGRAAKHARPGAADAAQTAAAKSPAP